MISGYNPHFIDGRTVALILSTGRNALACGNDRAAYEKGQLSTEESSGEGHRAKLMVGKTTKACPIKGI